MLIAAALQGETVKRSLFHRQLEQTTCHPTPHQRVTAATCCRQQDLPHHPLRGPERGEGRSLVQPGHCKTAR